MLFIFIAGASASGKTRLAQKLVETLKEQDVNAVAISMDHYYKRKQDRSANVSFDEPAAFDMALFHNQLRQLDKMKQ